MNEEELFRKEKEILEGRSQDENPAKTIRDIAKYRCNKIGDNSTSPTEFYQVLEDAWRIKTQQQHNNSLEIKDREKSLEECKGDIETNQNNVRDTTDEIEKTKEKIKKEINDRYEKIKTDTENNTNKKIKSYELEIENRNKRIDTLKKQRESELATKPRKLTFRLKLEILLAFLLLCYLWIFYSAATYSAFFKDADSLGTNIVNIFLDPTAISEAYSKGIIHGLFITLFPFIFVALGYMTFSADDAISEAKTIFGKFGKYIQKAFILIGALFYDILIAYIIANNVYTQTIGLGRTEEFNWEICIRDPHFWLIIGAGYIVYLIFGYVCGLASQRWADLNPQENNVRNIERQIKEANAEIEKFNKEIEKSKIEENNHKFDSEQNRCEELQSLSSKPEVTALEENIKRYEKAIERLQEEKTKLEQEISNLKNDNSMTRQDAYIYKAYNDGWIDKLVELKANNIARECQKVYLLFKQKHPIKN